MIAHSLIILGTTIGILVLVSWVLKLDEKVAILERQVRRHRDDFAQYRHDVTKPPRSIY